MIGKVAECKRGIVGVICYRKFGIHKFVENGDETYETTTFTDRKPVYYGVTLDGEKWQSKYPKIISNSINEYFKAIFGEDE